VILRAAPARRRSSGAGVAAGCAARITATSQTTGLRVPGRFQQPSNDIVSAGSRATAADSSSAREVADQKEGSISAIDFRAAHAASVVPPTSGGVFSAVLASFTRPIRVCGVNVERSLSEPQAQLIT
jgi:hypothetical protein